MNNKRLLEKTQEVKAIVNGFQEDVRGGNMIDFAFKMGEWKSTLDRQISELEDLLYEEIKKEVIE